MEVVGPSAYSSGRDRHVVVAGRFDPAMWWETAEGIRPRTTQAQITPACIEVFARRRDSTLVYPDLDTYNDRLAAALGSV